MRKLKAKNNCFLFCLIVVLPVFVVLVVVKRETHINY
jgi:hypothetical protein